MTDQKIPSWKEYLALAEAWDLKQKVTTPPLTAEWGDAEACENCRTMKETIYKEDGSCSCGIQKHHYHCSDCGKVIQIG